MILFTADGASRTAGMTAARPMFAVLMIRQRSLSLTSITLKEAKDSLSAEKIPEVIADWRGLMAD
jgi:hypothetical protein